MSEPKRDEYGRIVYEPQDIEKNKVLCAIGYVPILFLIPMFACKDSQFAKYHVNQGLLFTLVSLVLGIAAWLITFTGPGVVLSWVLEVILLVLFLRQFVGTIQGGTPSLPVIGDKVLLK